MKVQDLFFLRQNVEYVEIYEDDKLIYSGKYIYKPFIDFYKIKYFEVEKNKAVIKI